MAGRRRGRFEPPARCSRIAHGTRACLTARAVGSGGCWLLDVGGHVVRRHELTDQAWAEIAPLLPANGRPGGQWADHRRVLNGILWKLATGVPWRDLPERYGPWQTCSERFRRSQADGTWSDCWPMPRPN